MNFVNLWNPEVDYDVHSRPTTSFGKPDESVIHAYIVFCQIHVDIFLPSHP